MPHFIKTGFWALEQKGYKGWLKLEDIIGGGGSGVVEVTYTALQTLISSGALSPGTIYKITGFNKNMPIGGPSNPNGYLPEVLYDDGTNAGVTIYMQAITKNTLSNDGYGEFYNPVYGDQTTYTNTDGTGLYGIWDGDNPDPLEVPAYVIDQVVFWGGYAWRNVTGNVGIADDIITLSADWEKLPYYNSPHYELVIDEIKVDWDNGIVIGRTNIENQVTVEFNADQYYWWMGLYSTLQCSPISVMAWGLYSKVTPEQLDDAFYGISNVKVINSVCETVNFKGAGFININMDSSYLYKNYIGFNSYVTELDFKLYSYFQNNIIKNSSIYKNILISANIDNNTLNGTSMFNSLIGDNTLTNTFSGISYNKLDGGGGIYNNTLNNGGSIYDNIVDISCIISTNTLDDSSIYTNTLDNNSNISNNTLDNSNISNNTLDNSYINYNILDNSSSINLNLLNDISNIYKNTLNLSNIISNELTDVSNIYNNTLTNNSVIDINTLTTNCYINNNVLSNDSSISTNTITSVGAIDYNRLHRSSITNTTFLGADYISNNNLNFSNFTFTNLSKQVRFNNVENCNVVTDLATANRIYDAYYKLIFKNSSSVIRLGYYDASDVFTVVAVNA